MLDEVVEVKLIDIFVNRKDDVDVVEYLSVLDSPHLLHLLNFLYCYCTFKLELELLFNLYPPLLQVLEGLIKTHVGYLIIDLVGVVQEISLQLLLILSEDGLWDFGCVVSDAVKVVNHGLIGVPCEHGSHEI